MGFRLLGFNRCKSAVRTRRTDLMLRPRIRPALAAIAILGCLLPVPAAAEVDFGFNLVDNSAGGSIMDNYITQELWSDTNLQWLGTQFRLELDQGTIFQDELDGSGLMTEYNHDLLAATFDQPSLAYDTRIGVNGHAPSTMPGGAINIGGSVGLQFTDTEINITYGPGGGEYHSGAFDFGTFTLSKDAVGHGALMFSMHGEDEGGHYAQTFEIDQGVIRLTGERVNLEDSNYTYTVENWQFVRHEIPSRPPEPEPEPPAPAPPIAPIDPPQVDAPPVIEPDPMPQPEPLPDPIEDPTEPPLPEPDEPILIPGDPIDRVIEFPYFEMPLDPIDDMLRLPISLPHLDDFGWRLLIVDGVPMLTTDLVLDGTLHRGSEIVIHEGGTVTVLDAEYIQANRGVTGFMDVAQTFAGTSAEFLTTAVMGNSGGLLVPLSALSDAQRTSLLATGHWSLEGDYLLYSNPAGVPEPSSFVLLLLAAADLGFWWRRRK